MAHPPFPSIIFFSDQIASRYGVWSPDALISTASPTNRFKDRGPPNAKPPEELPQIKNSLLQFLRLCDILLGMVKGPYGEQRTFGSR